MKKLLFAVALLAFAAGTARGTPGHQCFSNSACSHCEACIAIAPGVKVGNCAVILGCR